MFCSKVMLSLDVLLKSDALARVSATLAQKTMHSLESQPHWLKTAMLSLESQPHLLKKCSLDVLLKSDALARCLTQKWCSRSMFYYKTVLPFESQPVKQWRRFASIPLDKRTQDPSTSLRAWKSAAQASHIVILIRVLLKAWPNPLHRGRKWWFWKSSNMIPKTWTCTENVGTYFLSPDVSYDLTCQDKTQDNAHDKSLDKSPDKPTDWQHNCKVMT